MTVSISSEKIGVGVSVLPTITFVVWIWPPLSTRRSRNSGMFTATWRAPRSAGSHRQRSMLATRSPSRSAADRPDKAATVCAVRMPFAGRPFSRWNAATAEATRSS